MDPATLGGKGAQLGELSRIDGIAVERTWTYARPGGSIYVGNLPYTVTDQDLVRIFGRYGEVGSATRGCPRSDAGCHRSRTLHPRRPVGVAGPE